MNSRHPIRERRRISAGHTARLRRLAALACLGPAALLLGEMCHGATEATKAVEVLSGLTGNESVILMGKPVLADGVAVNASESK